MKTPKLTARNVFVIAMLLIVLFALAKCAQPARAASTSDPTGYRRCRIGEIAADPNHRVCKVMTWVEWHSGGTVRYTAFVRKVGK